MEKKWKYSFFRIYLKSGLLPVFDCKLVCILVPTCPALKPFAMGHKIKDLMGN